MMILKYIRSIILQVVHAAICFQRLFQLHLEIIRNFLVRFHQYFASFRDYVNLNVVINIAYILSSKQPQNFNIFTHTSINYTKKRKKNEKNESLYCTSLATTMNVQHFHSSSSSHKSGVAERNTTTRKNSKRPRFHRKAKAIACGEDVPGLTLSIQLVSAKAVTSTVKVFATWLVAAER